MEDTFEYEIKPMPVIAERRYSPWCGKLLQATKHVGRRAFTAILIGCALVMVTIVWTPASQPTNLPQTSSPRIVSPSQPSENGGKADESSLPFFAYHLMQEFAIAFLVSGIVIFAFEWGSEVKHSLDISGMFANALTNHIDRVLEGSSVAQVQNAMERLAGPQGMKFSSQFRSFAESVRRLGQGGWTAQGYRDFIEWYHSELVIYAESLADLSLHLANDLKSKAEFRLVLPDATVPIDVMLAQITRAMESCGAYYAISDLFTWTKLSDFHAAQKEALDLGLQIRRIFIIGKHSDSNVKAREVETHLRGHYKEAKESSCNYRIRLMSHGDFERLASPILTRTEHFGIFEPADPTRHPLIVQVLDAQLLTFRIAGAGEANLVLAAFRQLWRQLEVIDKCGENDPAIDEPRGPRLIENQSQDVCCPDQAGSETGQTEDEQPVTSPKATRRKPRDGMDLIRDHLMAYRMRQLPRTRTAMSWYHGASGIDQWTQGGLKEFEQAVEEAAEDGIEIKRLFIFADGTMISNVKDDPMLRTLRKHADMSRRRPNYQWRIILKSKVPADLTRESFALFRDGMKPPSEGPSSDDIEVARGDGDNFRFGATAAEAAELEEGFEELWYGETPQTPDVVPLLSTLVRATDSQFDSRLQAIWLEMEKELQNRLQESLKKVLKADALRFVLRIPEEASGNDQPQETK